MGATLCQRFVLIFFLDFIVLNVKPKMHSGNNPYLIMVYYPFCILLFKFAKILFRKSTPM